MKKIFYTCFLILLVVASEAQTTDTTTAGKMTIIKDSRLAELAKKELAFNESISSAVARSARGYRLMLLSTNDRNLAMKVRTQLLQKFPEQKVYMSFQPPYIKLKFGNFLDKDEAEMYKKDILRYQLVNNNIYVVSETIEVKPEKNSDK